MTLTKLNDNQLLENIKILVQKEREVLSEILKHLRKIQRRRLYSDLGLPSLFVYCVQVLKYSESQAQRRITAMRMINEIPEIEEKVSTGELSLTNISQAKSFFNQEEKLAPMTTQEKLEILEELKNKSSREGEKILIAKAAVAPSPVVEKLKRVSATVTQVNFAADDELLVKINKLKGLLAYKKSGINTSELINELCEIALEKLDPAHKENKRKVPNPIPPAPKVESSKPKMREHISLKLRYEIWAKTGGKCQKCGSQNALEIDHVKPVALGGNSQMENLRLLCRNCNIKISH